MCNEHPEFQNYVATQCEMFAEAKRVGLPPRVLARKAVLPPTTVEGWANGTAMPAWAFSILTRFLPDEISSMMMEHSDKVIVPAVPEDALIDDLVTEAAELGADYARARHPNSPGGIRIVHSEEPPIKRRARRVAALAAAVAK
jgi:hypothetical protein